MRCTQADLTIGYLAYAKTYEPAPTFAGRDDLDPEREELLKLLWRQAGRPLSDRLVKLAKRWVVTDLEHPGETLRGPIFKTKKAALEYAAANAAMVWGRITGQFD